jgi:hypothetical protein
MSDHDASVESGRLIEAAETQAIFRVVNERIKELNERFGQQHTAEWVCECGNASCSGRIEMPLAQYEWLRADGNRFAVLAGHDVQEVEAVTERHDGFLVVAKHGVGGARAVELHNRP